LLESSRGRISPAARQGFDPSWMTSMEAAAPPDLHSPKRRVISTQSRRYPCRRVVVAAASKARPLRDWHPWRRCRRPTSSPPQALALLPVQTLHHLWRSRHCGQERPRPLTDVHGGSSAIRPPPLRIRWWLLAPMVEASTDTRAMFDRNWILAREEGGRDRGVGFGGLLRAATLTKGRER
jgi:hypothetical protein